MDGYLQSRPGHDSKYLKQLVYNIPHLYLSMW